MNSKVVFILERVMFLRHFSGLIEHALERGLEVECWLHEAELPKNATKIYSIVRVSDFPRMDTDRQPRVLGYKSNDELLRLMRERHPDYLFSIYFPSHYFSPEMLGSLSFQWLTVMTSGDCYHMLSRTKVVPVKMQKTPILVGFSPFWQEMGQRYLEKWFPNEATLIHLQPRRYLLAGNPEFDEFKKVSANRTWTKYGIPRDRRIFLYLPFPFQNRRPGSAWEEAFCAFHINWGKNPLPDGRTYCPYPTFRYGPARKILSFAKILRDPEARRAFFNGDHEIAVFRAVRKFCDKHGLFLVSKPRLKTPVPEYIQRHSDLFLWDPERQNNPSMLKDLLAVSRVALSYCSYSMFSCAFSKVFHLNVSLPMANYSYDAEADWFPDKPGDFFNAPGVNTSWTSKRIIEDLESTPLEFFSVNEEARSQFVKKYMGHDDFESSRRVFDTLLREAEKPLPARPARSLDKGP